ncbi:MAG: hypothetical protein FWG10_02335 [Eubacteriaceae bacterium]|nr:hypothetical protein [Eubacteriaceae bacterium]
MTGILPIKKHGTHSALNMFDEYSMLEPQDFAPYYRFTEEEAYALCKIHGGDMEQMRSWYGGYHMKYWSGIGANTKNVEVSIYSTRSVVQSIRTGFFLSYWNQTENDSGLGVRLSPTSKSAAFSFTPQLTWDGQR